MKYNYTIKEKLLAIQLLGMARQSVAAFTHPDDVMQNLESEIMLCASKVLNLAAEYARSGADYSVLSVLEYPDTIRTNA